MEKDMEKDEEALRREILEGLVTTGPPRKSETEEQYAGFSPEKKNIARKEMIEALKILSGETADSDEKTYVSEVPDIRIHGSDEGNKKPKVLAVWSSGIINVYDAAQSMQLFSSASEKELEDLKKRVNNFKDSVEEVRLLVNAEADKRDMAERERDTEWRPRDQVEAEADLEAGSEEDEQEEVKMKVKIPKAVRNQAEENIKIGDALIIKMKEILNPNENPS
jgi:hypothetical protein